jgi:hypothetical protein
MDEKRVGVFVRDCPLCHDGLDFAGMALALTIATMDQPRDGVVITMEKVHSMPSDGKCAAFSFGVGYGAWLGIIGASGRKVNLVSPQTWKRTMLAGIANDKQAEALALKQRFQGHPVCAQLHGPRGGLRDGRVDALLLAEHGRLTWRMTSQQPRTLTPLVVAARPTARTDGRHRGVTKEGT